MPSIQLKVQPKLTQLQRDEIVMGLSDALIDNLQLTLRSYPKVDAEDCLHLLNKATTRAHAILMKAAQIEQRHAEES